ncbi:MAG: hypothetical protein V7K88_14185 [Nostoc sp.]
MDAEFLTREHLLQLQVILMLPTGVSSSVGIFGNERSLFFEKWFYRYNSSVAASKVRR